MNEAEAYLRTAGNNDKCGRSQFMLINRKLWVRGDGVCVIKDEDILTNW